MRIGRAVFPALIGILAAGPAFANSVAVTSGPNGTVVSGDQPCRVVHDHGGGNSTSITTGPNGVSGSTTVSPGGSGSSVTVGSGASAGGGEASAGAGSDCVIHRRDR